MSLNFPNNPVEDQTFAAEGGGWIFRNGAWVAVGGGITFEDADLRYLQLTGGTVTGQIRAFFDDDNPLLFRRSGIEWGIGLFTPGTVMAVRQSGAQVARFDPIGPDSPAALTLLTREKGDARYLQLTGGTVTGLVTLTSPNTNFLELRRTDIAPEVERIRVQISGGGHLVFNAIDDLGVITPTALIDRDPSVAPLFTTSLINRTKGDARYLRTSNAPSPAATLDQIVENSLVVFHGTDGSQSPLILSQFGGGSLVANRLNHGSTRLNTGGAAIQAGGPSQTAISTYFQGRDAADAAVFRVLVPTGNVQNLNNSYAGLSDVRLKENITDANQQLADLLKLRVVNFNFIGHDTKNIGLIAQEVEKIKPGLVEETQDTTEDENGPRNVGEPIKSIKYSVLVPMLLKAVQELTARVEELEAR